jgi:hypothetical protein
MVCLLLLVLMKLWRTCLPQKDLIIFRVQSSPFGMRKKSKRVFKSSDKYDFCITLPKAFYFFVAPKQKKLAADLTKGLERAIADGSFDAVFNKYFQKIIQQEDINNRIIFELKNPLIKPNLLPLDNVKLWFHPEHKSTQNK